MTPYDLLRYGWKPNELRLLLAAMQDAGPVLAGDWAVRSGVPANHLAAVLGECVRLGGMKSEARAEGICMWVQTPEFWRVREKCSVERWHEAWPGATQGRLALVTEAVGLGEALAAGHDGSGGKHESHGTHEPGGCPEFGTKDARNPGVHVPESGSRATHGPDHGHGHGPVHALNMPHGEETRNPGARADGNRKFRAGDRGRALELLHEHLFAGLEEQHRKHWLRRVDEDPGLVEYAIEEALLTRRGDRVSAPAAYANRVYLANVAVRGRLKA